MSNESNPEDKGAALLRRPTTWVGLVAIAVGVLIFVVSATHDYDASLPVYALELPLLLHMIHTALAVAIIIVGGGFLVRLFEGDAPEEAGAGPFSLRFGRTTRKAIRELRDALASDVEGLDRRLYRVEQDMAELKRLRQEADGEGSSTERDDPGAAPGDRPAAGS
jgi:uncharacterized integral membrane protein